MAARRSARQLCHLHARGQGGPRPLGIQAESGEELEDIGSRLAQSDVSTTAQKGASCCYAKSDKYWMIDPQGVAWESFHTLDSVPIYGDSKRKAPQFGAKACRVPAL